MPVIPQKNPRLTRYAWLSVAAAVATVALKFAAWALTGSVGLLSDALESLVIAAPLTSVTPSYQDQHLDRHP